VIEVWGGGVNTWECDEMGHLNVRFWVAKSFEGVAGLAAQLGMPRAFTAGAESTLVVREQHIRFLREARAGAGLIMTGGVVEIGETDARLLLVIRHLSGEPAASFQVVVSHVTSADLRPFPWPARIREAAQALMVEVPAFAAARSIDLSPVTPTAGYAKALALDMTRIGMGVIQPAECDVFGRMRGEIFIGRVSDGVNRLFSETRPGPPQEQRPVPHRSRLCPAQSDQPQPELAHLQHTSLVATAPGAPSRSARQSCRSRTCFGGRYRFSRSFLVVIHE